jgi:hypothetical protein
MLGHAAWHGRQSRRRDASLRTSPRMRAIGPVLSSVRGRVRRNANLWSGFTSKRQFGGGETPSSVRESGADSGAHLAHHVLFALAYLFGTEPHEATFLSGVGGRLRTRQQPLLKCGGLLRGCLGLHDFAH